MSQLKDKWESGDRDVGASLWGWDSVATVGTSTFLRSIDQNPLFFFCFLSLRRNCLLEEASGSYCLWIHCGPWLKSGSTYDVSAPKWHLACRQQRGSKAVQFKAPIPFHEFPWVPSPPPWTILYLEANEKQDCVSKRRNDGLYWG